MYENSVPHLINTQLLQNIHDTEVENIDLRHSSDSNQKTMKEHLNDSFEPYDYATIYLTQGGCETKYQAK